MTSATTKLTDEMRQALEAARTSEGTLAQLAARTPLMIVFLRHRG